MSTVVKDLGPVTAYAYAVAGGYTGTEEEFTELLGDLAATVADLESLTVTVTTLAPGSSATASYEDGVLALGIPQGTKGDTGTAATIAVGTVITVAPTQNASVTNTGSSSAAVFAFSIPRGDGVATVTKTGTSGNVDTYTMTSDRGVTLGTFTVTNGNVSSVNGKTGAVVLDAGDLGYDGSETYSGGTVGAEVAQLKEEMEALKPLEASEQHRKRGYLHDCPNCHCSLGYKEKAVGILPRWMRKTVLYEVCQPYCGFCGQKIDWSDVP